MAYTESISIPAHHNIYNGNNGRNLRIDFAIPDKGTNNNTGLFIFVPGFGGNIDSNVYKKMRSNFADKYNVVTIQCDYFGSRFMQGVSSFNFQNGLDSLASFLTSEELNQIKKDNTLFEKIISKYPIKLPVVAVVEEDENEFADMGYMQAIDILTAIEAIKILLHENQIQFNVNRVIGFGQSQGAYLLHLANILAPQQFSMIIDNAAWVKPVYLYSNRFLLTSVGKATLCVEFDYIAKSIIKDKASLSLNEIYKSFSNGAYIYSCIGTTDNLVDVNEKRTALSKLNHVYFEVIDSNKVDGVIFKSTNHGLDADFIHLVDYVLSITPQHHVNKNKKQIEYHVVSSKTKIHVDYSFGLPIFQFIE